MARIVLLDTNAHRNLRIRTQPDARFGNAGHFERIVAGEFAVAAAHYPILFAKDSETGAFFAGAMLGFDVGENLFLRDGTQWSYRPLDIRRQPFFISGEALAIDLDDPRVSLDEGEPLFDEMGAPSKTLKSVQSMLTQLKTGIDATDAFIKTLLKRKLIETIDLSFNFDDGEHCRLEGLYTISGDALRDLPDADVLALFRSGYLQLAYCVIGSLRQLPVLAQIRNERPSRVA